MSFRKNILLTILICLILLISITDADVPITSFRSNVTDGNLNLHVRFLDMSESPASWNWSFRNVTGDNIQVWWSTDQNPVIVFDVGNYSIVVNVSNEDGGNVSTIPYFINVSNSTAPDTHFYMQASSSGIPLYGSPDTLDGYAIGGSYYGGGTQYPAYTEGVAGGSYNGSTVSTKDHLLEALTQAADGIGGAVIYIDPSANINMTDSFDVVIPANTTIASNRGVDGSRGGKIYTKTPGYEWQGQLFETGGQNVRITGLVLEGETYEEDFEPESYEGAEYRIGLTIYDTGCVIDNNELWGFAYADIVIVDVPTIGRPWIHHNFINGSHNRHEGYGVELAGSSDALIEGNVFDRNRHDVTGGGWFDEKYTVRYNKFLDTPYKVVGMAHLDVHGQGYLEDLSGYRYDIYGNTFYGGNSSAVHQRGVSNGTYVHNNIINTVADDAGWTEGNVPVYQSSPGGYPFGNIYVYDNYWLNTSYQNQSGMIWYQEVLFVA